MGSPTSNDGTIFARGTQSNAPVPGGTPNTDVPVKVTKTMTHASTSATGTKSVGATPSGKISADEKADIMAQLAILQSRLESLHSDDVFHDSKSYPDPSGDDPGEDLVPEPDAQPVTVETVSDNGSELVTSPDYVTKSLLSNPKASKIDSGNQHGTPSLIADD